MFLPTRPLLQPPRVTGVLSEMLFSFWSLKGTTQDIRTGCCCTLWLERARRMYKSQHYQKCEKANRPGADFPDLSRDRIFQQPAPSGFKGTIRGELAVREGRNEDKWSKVQPLICREKSLRIDLFWLEVVKRDVTLLTVLCTGSPKTELDQSLFRKSQVWN